MNAPCHIYEYAISHIWMRYITNMNAPFHKWWSHVTRMNASCHTYECAMSHIWMCRVTRINAPCRTCVHATSHIERSTSHIWIRHVTCMYTGILKVEKWWHTKKWLVLRIWIYYVTCMNASFHMWSTKSSHIYIYEHAMSHIYMQHVTQIQKWRSHCISDVEELLRTCIYIYEHTISHVWMQHVAQLNTT